MFVDTSFNTKCNRSEAPHQSQISNPVTSAEGRPIGTSALKAAAVG
ncbi:hypothetical protein [Tychonema sp. LEGE 07203]|nr:hypothetical protein [Tychonema sp. LEGE 07203]MBE9095887.1 hypothetical protein [Tychonema sp. LEGE 07203]